MIFLYRDRGTGYCHINALDHSDPEQPTIMKYLPQPLNFYDGRTLEKVYLLVTFGDFIMVCRFKQCNDNENGDNPLCSDFSYRTTDFEVYKIKLGTKNYKHVHEFYFNIVC